MSDAFKIYNALIDGLKQETQLGSNGVCAV